MNEMGYDLKQPLLSREAGAAFLQFKLRIKPIAAY